MLSQEEYIPKPEHKFNFGIALQQGLTVNLPVQTNAGKGIKHVASANFFIGFTASVKYKKYEFETGLLWHSYTLGTAITDEQAKVNHSRKSTSEFYVYYQCPLHLGYVIETAKKHFSFQPFISAPLLYTLHSNVLYIGTGTGKAISPADSVYDSLAVKMARPYKYVFAIGGGIKINYHYKKLKIAFTAEYYQSQKTWSAIEVDYYRYSKLYGYYYQLDRFNSKASTLNLGISIGVLF